MNLNEFYTISYNNYDNSTRFENLNLIKWLNEDNNELSMRIYNNKKLLYRFFIYNKKIAYVKRGSGDYIKFNLINIKKELLQNSLKLLDSDDSLNHALFLEILKLKLNESTQM